MSRWIRGRLGRPIASIVSLVMLVMLFTPLAPPPVQAQDSSSGSIDWNALVEGNQNNQVPLVVLDFDDHSGYRTGMLDRHIANEMSLNFQGAKIFSVISQADIESALSALGRSSVPGAKDYVAQARVADYLDAPFTVSGEIEKVEVFQTKEGAQAEVTVNAQVISSITRLPINGARVVLRSTPRPGRFTGNMDELVYEALSNAAFQITRRILDNRLPLCSVMLASDTEKVQIKGGSGVGLRVGMTLVAVRDKTVSGILRITDVKPSAASAVVVENRKGVAYGDKLVQLFSLDAQHAQPTGKNIASKALPWALGLSLLAALVGHASSVDDPAEVASLTATQVADPGQTYVYGANIVKWSGSDRNVVAYVIYRNDGMGDLPVYVADPRERQWIDEADPNAYTIKYLDDGTIDKTESKIAFREQTVTITFDSKDSTFQPL